MHAPRVALLIETARRLRSRDAARDRPLWALHGPWSFYLTPGDFEQALPRMQQWGGTGTIARIETPQIAKAILAARLPTIALDLSDEQLRAGSPLAAFSQVESDSDGAARLAAEHLLERGFRDYAFVGIEGRVWSRRGRPVLLRRSSGKGFPRTFISRRAVKKSAGGNGNKTPGGVAGGAAQACRADGLRR